MGKASAIFTACYLLAILFVPLVLSQDVQDQPCMLYDTLENRVVADADCDMVPDKLEQPGAEPGSGSPAGQEAVQQPAANDVNVQYITSHDLEAGKLGEIYPIAVRNTGVQPVTAEVSISNIASWGTFSIGEKRTVISPGETKMFYLYVRALPDAAAGTYPFRAVLNVDGAEQALDLEAKVDAAARPGLPSFRDYREGLEIGLIVIIILLLIIGIIVGFDRMRRPPLTKRVEKKVTEEEFFREL